MNANDAYAAKLNEAKRLIREIEGRLSSHKARQSAHPDDWGYVGDMGAIVARLAEIEESRKG